MSELYHKTCAVCCKPFESESRNTKYCSGTCSEFAQVKVGRLRQRRRKRDLNRQFHLEWTRRHREDRDKYIQENAIIQCRRCGAWFKLKEFEVHHKDGDFRNGAVENLDGLCDPCHKLAESELRKAGKPTDENPGEAKEKL